MTQRDMCLTLLNQNHWISQQKAFVFDHDACKYDNISGVNFHLVDIYDQGIVE